MTFTSPVERVAPDRVTDERESLTQQLDYHRATLLGKLEGLDTKSLRQPRTGSGLRLLGLVKHLTETERGWFLEIFAGRSDEHSPATDSDSAADFRVGSEETVEVIVGRYVAICDRARAVVANAGLDRVVSTPWHREVNLRAILLHMIQETARHNGHADIIREGIDGATGQ